MTTATVAQNYYQHPAFSQHVHTVAARAEQCLPAAAGRIARAVELVLGGCVEAMGAGRWEVASQTNFPDRWYEVRDNTCTCPDYQHRSATDPDMVCKHIVSTWLYRRAVQAIEKEEIMSQDPLIYDITLHDPVEQEPITTREPLQGTDEDGEEPHRPEPCEATFVVMINDHAVSIQLSDTDDFQLLCRIEHVLNYCHRNPDDDTDDAPAVDVN